MELKGYHSRLPICSFTAILCLNFLCTTSERSARALTKRFFYPKQLCSVWFQIENPRGPPCVKG